MKILALNAGSRSHRAQLFAFDGIPSLEPPRAAWDAADESATGRFAELLETYRGEPPDAVVHRFVHPGPELAERIAFRVDDEARSLIERSDLAPAHNPLALDGLRAASDRFAGAVQIGISDIALGPDAPAIATTYPLPHAWRERFGIRRYGFHGISQRDALERNARLCGSDDPARRVVSVHLGSGCSIVAGRGRFIIDSTMGMTPMEGLMMGSRSGSIDPGIIFTLLRRGASAWHVALTHPTRTFWGALVAILRATAGSVRVVAVSAAAPAAARMSAPRVMSAPEEFGVSKDIVTYISLQRRWTVALTAIKKPPRWTVAKQTSKSVAATSDRFETRIGTTAASVESVAALHHQANGST
jgi:hypothetical protein